MRAKFIFETLDFERGQNPKKSMRIGKYNSPSLMRIAFDDPLSRMKNTEKFFDDMSPIVKKILLELPLEKNENIYCFPIDYYAEEKDLNPDDFGFIPIKDHGEGVIEGKIRDGSKILFYQKDLYITRDSWLK